MRFAAILALAMFLLAGCAVQNSSDGQTASGKGTLSYNGASNGSHTSKPFSCDGSGQININHNMGSGSLEVTVKTGTHTAYSKTFSSVGQASRSDSFQGPSGDYIITATRSGGSIGAGFSGQYNINAAC
jgi:hypothetical protein